MDEVPHTYDSSTVGSRFAAFLREFTAPLFSPSDQADIIDTFDSLTDECLRDTKTVEEWSSDLCPDGVPMEFSLAVDGDGSISLRYIIDAQHGPQPSIQSIAKARRRANVVVPRHKKDSAQFIDRLFRLHLEGGSEVSLSQVAHGARFSPDRSRAGRLYFRTWRRDLHDVYGMLADCLSDEDMRSLRSSPLGSHVIVGVGYDFTSHGLGRVKIYSWTEALPRETCMAVAGEYLGERAYPLIQLLDMIASRAHPLWVMPRTLIGVGFRPDGGYRDLKLCLPVSFWEWETFQDLRAAVSLVLNQWGIPICIDSAANPSGAPCWSFVPTWLSVDASPKGESLSVYFKPTKRIVQRDSAGDGPYLTPTTAPLISDAESGKKRQAIILDKMFDVLLKSDAANCP